MPIIRTYGCPHCGHVMEAELRAEDWNIEPPECPLCASQTQQEFAPVAIGGSHRGRATALTEKILAEDYNVADLQSPSRSGPRVRYKDQPANPDASTWAAGGAQLQQAMALGRETRLQHGNGLDVLQGALKSGAQVDLIEASRRRSMKVW